QETGGPPDVVQRTNVRSRQASPSRRRQTKDERRRLLIDAATSVFAERGYEGATTREIAQRAGCSEAVIYHHFAGKRDLLLAVIDEELSNLTERIHSTDRDDLGAEISELMVSRLDWMWEHQRRMRVAFQLLMTDEELGRTVGHGAVEQGLDLFREKLR